MPNDKCEDCRYAHVKNENGRRFVECRLLPPSVGVDAHGCRTGNYYPHTECEQAPCSEFLPEVPIP